MICTRCWSTPPRSSTIWLRCAIRTARRRDCHAHRSPAYTAIAHRAWGVAHTLAGEYPQAETRLQQALEIFTAYPAPWQMGRTLFEMGELARAQRKRSRHATISHGR